MTTPGPRQPMFPLGRIFVTPGAMDAFNASSEVTFAYLVRHVMLDQGLLSDEDHAENARAVEDGSRIVSAFSLRSGVKVWVITEADRSVTTVLLPEEY